MRIILDVMGADKPVEEFVKGAVSAISEFGCEVTLVGNKAMIQEAITNNRLSTDHLYIVNAPEFITMEDSPMSVVKEKNNSSMHEGLKMLADGKGDAFVSAGNTGALLAGATFVVRRIRGLRAAIGTILPLAKPVLLVDSGANLTVTPENLEQFAKMGSIYMEKLHGINNPTVGLLNNGTEHSKGHELQRETFLRLSVSDSVNFVGNIEGKDIPFAKTDIIVTDGFTGNVVLKLTEGFGKFMIDQLTQLFSANLLGKSSYLMLKRNLKDFKKKFDASEYGGAPLLGISKPVIKAHGSSDAKAVKNAIKQAIYYVNTGIIVEIARQTSQISPKSKETEKQG
ncbi:MAG: phosphate acyltransferase PlsX [Clostridia bacterium]|nr:phosphate acyltransferase PlsX [Oscillospiraceae bacterium]MBQ6701523.1 phosphate acyltransferase PlsX [Clostridia bacterium]